MYLRWQSRKRRSAAFRSTAKKDDDVHWAAIIVESARVEGKPTQRHVAYLGGITESAIAIVAQRAWFWDDVKRRLDRMPAESRISVQIC
jgi:hypothetical protein